jgi:acyl dehydratase
VVSVIVMRAHSAIVSPRPPGNIHVGQRFTVHAPIELGQDLRATVTCREKRISGTRKIVIFSVGIADAASGEPLLEGVNTMFWAA